MAGPDTTALQVEPVRQWLQALQLGITDALQAEEDAKGSGVRFTVDPWQKEAGSPLQGDGVTRIQENGAVFERAGCGFSHVRGAALPPSRSSSRARCWSTPPAATCWSRPMSPPP